MVDTANKEIVSTEEVEAVSTNDTTVSFSENLLRQIIPLTPDQQLELISNLANARIAESPAASNRACSVVNHNKKCDPGNNKEISLK